MTFDFQKDLKIFDTLLEKRPEISLESLTKDLKDYYIPFIQKIVELKLKKRSSDGIIIGISAIQGAGKTTQGEILEILLNHLGHSTVSLSIDDHYITHDELCRLREKDPRFIRRGLTHDIPLAISQLHHLKTMQEGEVVKLVTYDKGAFHGDGDRNPESLWKIVTKKPDFIFYDGWMLGARSVQDENIFESGLPALDTSEHIQFAKDCNKKLLDYQSLWDLLDFMNVLYVPNYEISLTWRDQAEDALRAKGEGMSHEEIRQFVYYFWRSVHPAIQVKNLVHDSKHTDQVVVINDDHSIKEVSTPDLLSCNF